MAFCMMSLQKVSLQRTAVAASASAAVAAVVAFVAVALLRLIVAVAHMSERGSVGIGSVEAGAD